MLPKRVLPKHLLSERNERINKRADELLRNHTVKRTKEIISKESGLKVSAIHSIIYIRKSPAQKKATNYSYPDLSGDFSINVNPKH